MTKLFVTLPALALVVALSGSALADNGTVSKIALQEMGLAGMQVMSDEEAMSIRGLGWSQDPHQMPQPNGGHEKPWSLAFGVSFATVDVEGRRGGGEAGTLDGFLAEGKFMASGAHLSEAGYTKTMSTELQVKGLPATLEIKTRSLRVYAGGSATASSL